MCRTLSSCPTDCVGRLGGDEFIVLLRNCDAARGREIGQRLLQALLGYSAPAYAHHRLILDKDGRKFSKRDRSVTIRGLRAAGVTPAGIEALF